MELVCPAGGLPALKAAVDQGADWVYVGLRDDTNARNFPGLNFDARTLATALDYAHARGRKVVVAINTYPQESNWARWIAAVDQVAELRADAAIIADAGLMRYARNVHPRLALHLSVQGSATSYEAINFFHEHFGVKRAVLPRVLSLAQVEQIVRKTPVEIEVFGFGGLCVMVEGRCSLSGYACGESPNMSGACSPAKWVRWEETKNGLEARLNGVLVNRYAEGERAAYPTICKGRYGVEGELYYVFEEPASLNTVEMLPEFIAMGVHAVKIEGRQRSPAYVTQVTRVWRQAIDAAKREGERFKPRAEWTAALAGISEGSQCTLGAFSRPWK